MRTHIRLLAQPKSMRTEIEPLRESSCTFLLEGLPAFKMPLVVEVVIDLTVIADKFLERCARFETLHSSFSSSKWLM